MESPSRRCQLPFASDKALRSNLRPTELAEWDWYVGSNGMTRLVMVVILFTA